MQKLSRAVESTSESGEQLAALMQAVKVLLKLCEAKVSCFLSKQGAFNRQSLDELASDVERLDRAAMVLQEVINGIIGAVRADLTAALADAPRLTGEDKELAELTTACDTTLSALELIERSMHIVVQKAGQDAATLREAGLRVDAGPELAVTFEELMRRMKRPRAQS